jgi:hypothetical protein
MPLWTGAIGLDRGCRFGRELSVLIKLSVLKGDVGSNRDVGSGRVVGDDDDDVEVYYARRPPS